MARAYQPVISANVCNERREDAVNICRTSAKIVGGVEEMNELARKWRRKRGARPRSPCPIRRSILRRNAWSLPSQRRSCRRISGELHSLFSRFALHAGTGRTVASLSRGWLRSTAKPGHGGAGSPHWRLVDCASSRRNIASDQRSDQKGISRAKAHRGRITNDTSVSYLPHADEFPKGKFKVEDALEML